MEHRKRSANVIAGERTTVSPSLPSAIIFYISWSITWPGTFFGGLSYDVICEVAGMDEPPMSRPVVREKEMEKRVSNFDEEIMRNLFFADYTKRSIDVPWKRYTYSFEFERNENGK